MPISKTLLAKKLDFLNLQLTKIERMELDEEALVSSADIQDLLTFRLQQAVETGIDIATHIIAGLSLSRKETAKDAFLLLGTENIIDKELAGHLGKAADFRNRVVHGYNDFDFRLLFRDYKDDVKDLRNFGAQMIAFLEKGRQKGFAPIVILLTLLVLGGIVGGMVYFKSKTNQPTSIYPQPTSSRSQISIIPTISQSDKTTNWKTYASRTFSFRYPMEYTLYENQIVSVDGEVVPKQGTIEIVSPLINALNTNFTLSITSDQNNISKSLSEVVDYISTCSSISSVNGKPYTLGGVPAMIFADTTPCGPLGGTYIYAVNGNFFYVIQIDSHARYGDIHSSIDQILSTFRFDDLTVNRFTNGSESDPIANWTTYTSAQHGFIIKYPPNVEIYEKTSEDAVDFVLDGPTQRRQSENSDGLALRFTSGSLGEKTLKDFVLERSNNGAEILIPFKPTTFAGISGYTYRARGLGASTYIYVLKGQGEYIEIIDYTIDPTGKGFERIVDQILSTFKFTQ